MKTIIILASVALLAACGAKETTGLVGKAAAPPAAQDMSQYSMQTLKGSVFYRERIMLPPGVEVEVQLQDISRADAPATVVSSVSMQPEGGPPYDFSLEYDAAAIDERMRYAVRATIRRGDRLLFTTTDYVNPFAEEQPLQLLVRAVAAPAKAAAGVAGVRWGLATLEGETVAPGAAGKPVDLQLSSEDGMAAGFSGCNRYSGSFSLQGSAPDGAALTFGPSAGTMMACPEGMELEQKYLAMLSRVSSYRLLDGDLVLLGGSEELATFRPL